MDVHVSSIVIDFSSLILNKSRKYCFHLTIFLIFHYSIFLGYYIMLPIYLSYSPTYWISYIIPLLSICVFSISVFFACLLSFYYYLKCHLNFFSCNSIYLSFILSMFDEPFHILFIPSFALFFLLYRFHISFFLLMMFVSSSSFCALISSNYS